MTVFDTARAAAKLIASEAYNEGFGCDPWGAVIEALAAARSSTTCEECRGDGYIDTSFGDEMSWPNQMHCDVCGGSGTVPGGPLLLLAPEQVGWRGTPSWSAIPTLFVLGRPAAELLGDRVPVFVAREPT